MAYEYGASPVLPSGPFTRWQVMLEIIKILFPHQPDRNKHQARSQGGGGVRGGSDDPPPQLPIPKILFHPLAILFHLSAILFHPLAILFHPSAILFHPLAILFHPWNMWMTSHGQCPRGGVLVNVQEWGRFSNWWRHADNVQGGGGGCAWCSTHPSSDPPPHLAGWLRAWTLNLNIRGHCGPSLTN